MMLSPLSPAWPIDAPGRRAMASIWAFRARSEEEAVTRFARLAGQLAEHGAPPILIEIARRAADDERRHAALCAQLAALYWNGGNAPRQAAADAAEIGPARFPPRDRLLYEVVAFSCITETINAALMTVLYRRARNPVIRAAVRQILKDEVAHGRLGWGYLASERARGRGDFVGELLPRMLAGAASEELFTLPPAAPDLRLVDHGELPFAERLEVFGATLRDVLFPGFESFGIDTRAGRAWLRNAGLRLAGDGART